MATLPALVTALAKTDGRPRETIEHVARVIRERGYITTGKRGGAATSMKPHEAANLIIGLCGTDTPKDAPNAIDRYRSLLQWGIVGKGSLGSAQLEKYNSYPKAIQDLMDVHTFGEAIESLIENVPDLMWVFRQYTADAWGDNEDAKINHRFLSFLNLGVFGIDISFFRCSAKIEFFGVDGHGCRRVDFETQFQADAERVESGFYGNLGSDRRVTVTIGMRTLIAAFEATVAEDGDAPAAAAPAPETAADPVAD